MKRFVIYVLVGIVLSGCAYAMRPEQWQYAENCCKANGGVEWASYDLVQCKNGAKFDMKH